jgi:hypothetical protein
VRGVHVEKPTIRGYGMKQLWSPIPTGLGCAFSGQRHKCV